jgi:hypothetical protein
MSNYISRSITISWDGDQHKIDVNNDLCNHLESCGINLFTMNIELNSGGTPKMFLLGNLIARLLNYVGVMVHQDDVMRKLTQEPKDSIAMYKFANSFVKLCFPVVDESTLGK